MANAGIPVQALPQMFPTMYAGTIRQVTNVPIDVRIERWLRERHSSLRAAQQAPLRAQVQMNARVLDREIARITPPTIYRASTVMGCAFARAMALLYDDAALAAPYRDTEVWTLGGELLDLIDQERDDADGDVALVDRWAEMLGVRGWYRWAALDTLPDAAVSA